MRGDAFGHFIVLSGYRSSDQSVAIADPLLDNPAHGTKYYRATVHRLIGAIFLGVGSDDGNLLVIRPKGWKQRDRGEEVMSAARAPPRPVVADVRARRQPHTERVRDTCSAVPKRCSPRIAAGIPAR